MSTKDWLLLIVPIVCNGVVLFVLQRLFEKRQLAIIEKYKYVSIMQQKVDNALSLFTKVLQNTGNDSEQIYSINQFVNSYCDVFYYYQQNMNLLKPLEKYMNELVKAHEQLEQIMKNNDGISNPEISFEIEESLRKIFGLLQSIQSDCILRKV
jgi:hypothetical protein